MTDEIPTRLRDLDPDTILWLDRLNSGERDALIWASHLTKLQRDRLDQFLALETDKFRAGFTIVELWTRLWWLGKTSTWIIATIAALILAITQIIEYLGKLRQ